MTSKLSHQNGAHPFSTPKFNTTPKPKHKKVKTSTKIKRKTMKFLKKKNYKLSPEIDGI